MAVSNPALRVPPGSLVSDVLVTKADGTTEVVPAYTSDELAEITAPPWLREMRSRLAETGETSDSD